MRATAPSSVQSRPAATLAGWPLLAWATSLVVVLCAIALLASGGGEAGWRAAVRMSARTSFVLFTAAFVASSLRVLWPIPFTHWLLANRRYVGVSFAASHAIHLVAIAGLVAVAPAARPGLAGLVLGGLAYVFLAAMTATSFDRSAAWLGPHRWHLLHKTGMYYCWFIFFVSYVPRALGESASYLPLVAILLAALALRAAARRPRR